MLTAPPSLNVQCSSPVPIPSTALLQSAHPFDLPAGTIPVSPGPMQRAFELDCATMSPSPPSSPMLQNPLLTPIPGTNLTFEDIQLADNVYSSDPLESQECIGYFPPVNMGTAPGCIEATNIHAVANKYHKNQETPADRTLHLHEATKEYARPTIHCRESSCAPSDQTPITYHAEDIEFPIDLTHVVWEKPLIASLASVDISARQSTWGDHNGLYDGTGYGDESRSSVTNDVPPTIERGDEPMPALVEDVEKRVDQNAKPAVKPVQVEINSLKPAHCQAGYESLEEVIRSYAVFECCSPAVSPGEKLVEYHGDANTGNEEMSSGV